MAEERVIKIGMLGLGTVGTGVYKVLKSQQEEMLPKLGARVELKKILVRNVEKAAAKVDDPSIITTSFEEIANDPEIEIVVEVMGGKQPAMNYILACLDAGKNVVTANKDLVASEGKKILATAKRNGKDFLYEASVAGGIPIIRPVKQCLAANHITELMGIFNGTTNFILTKMSQEGMEFGDALRLAQDMGYAEADPTADVEGYDTCRKIAILTAMATGKEVDFEDIQTEGITKITDVDFKYADKMGTSIKLFGTSRMNGDQVFAWVAPLMIGKSHPLYAVNDVFNGIMVKGNMLGTSMFYGSGAGKLPTASAVVADIIEEAKNLHHNIPLGWTSEKQVIQPMEDSSHKYFVRISGVYESQKDKLQELFGTCKVITLEGADEFALLTEVLNEKQFRDAKAAFEAADGKVLQVIRAEA